MALSSTIMDYAARIATPSAARDSAAVRSDAAPGQSFVLAEPERSAAPAPRRPAPVAADRATTAKARSISRENQASRQEQAQRRELAARSRAPEPGTSADPARVQARTDRPEPGKTPTQKSATDRTAAEPRSSTDATADSGRGSSKTTQEAPKAPVASAPAKGAAAAADAAKPAPDMLQALVAEDAAPAQTGDGIDTEGEEAAGDDSDMPEQPAGMISLAGLFVPPPPTGLPSAGARGGNGSAPAPDESGIKAASAGAATAAVPVAPSEATAEGAVPVASGQAFDGLLVGADASFADLSPTPPASAPTLAHTAGTSTAEAAAAASPQAQAAPVPLGAVPMTIGLRSLAGSNRFEIRLDPKDLGRIEVNLDIDKDSGTITASLVVDRPETLALLQRDAGNLQQALSQAGFEASDASINLSLRSDTGSDGRNGDGREAGGGRSDASGGAPGSDLKDPRLSLDAVPLRSLRGLGGIDIRI